MAFINASVEVHIKSQQLIFLLTNEKYIFKIELKMEFPTEELRGFYKNNNEIVHKKTEFAMTLMEPCKYEEVKNNLQAKLKCSQIHFFGSRLLGLANKNSDLDLFIETGK